MKHVKLFEEYMEEGFRDKLKASKDKLVKKAKEFGKALEIFQKIEKKNVKDKKIFFYLGLVYFELNKYNKSMLYFIC